MRRFEICAGFEGHGIALPARATAASAGYDLAAAEDVVIGPGETALVPTGLCARMAADEFLAVFVRSSLGIRRGLVLANGTGIIDADYAGNPDNGGHILLALRNTTGAAARIARGERVAQGIFQRYLLADGDAASTKRAGGIGSSG